MTSVRAAYWVWRRELQVTLRGPIVYVIGGLFLVVQGLAFAGLVAALSDPRRPAPLGALLEGQLAGTLLTWVLQLVVLALLGMRTIAEERRGGGWELLLTAGVGEGAAVVGKWLAAVTIYALAWLPTLAYLAVVAAFRSDGGGWDIATIACGYAGAIALGAALLAWAVAASAATSTPLAAGALAFALLIGLLLVGEVPSVWPEVATEAPRLARALEAMSLRTQLGSLARGEVGAPALVLIGGLAVVGLSAAIALACAGRRRRREVRARTLATVLLAAIAVLAGMVAARHPARWDVSAARRNSLDAQTREVLAELPGPAKLTIIEPTLGALAPLYDEVARVIGRMTAHAAIEVVRVDPAALPGGSPAAAARLAGIAPGDLAANGGVVVEIGGHRRVVDVLDLADIARDAQGAPAIQHLAIERALAGALAELAAPRPITACMTTGHGELPITRADQDADWHLVAQRLEGDGIRVTELSAETLATGVPARCDVVVVAGPATPFTSEQALALYQAEHEAKGLLIAAASRPLPDGDVASTGLENLLASAGLALPHALVVDPSLGVRELPGALIVVDGYAAQPINEGFARARPTLWYQPRAVQTSAGAVALVSASKASTVVPVDRGEVPALAPPIALAALGHRGQVIAVGSAESFASSMLEGGASAGDLWLAHAVRFLAGKPVAAAAIAARTAEEVRLVMTSGQRRAVIALCTAGIPLAWLLVGAGVLMWRRRRAA